MIFGLGHSIVGAVPAVLQQKESPFADVLGWLIVFFVVIWPIVRGLLDSASEQRKRFEEEQRKKSGRPTAGTEKRSRLDEFVEELISARPDTIDAEPREPDVQVTPPPTVVEEAPPPVPRRRPQAQTRPTAKRRPRPKRSRPTPAPSTDVAPSISPDLSGDPFDESLMASDLVPDVALPDLPAEEQLEIGGPDEIVLSELDDTLKDSEIGSGATVRRTSALERIQRGRTPWQAAFVLREVLGPPASSRGTGDDLPR